MGSILSCATAAYSHVLFFLLDKGPGSSEKINCCTHLKEHARCGGGELRNVCVCVSGSYHSFGHSERVYHTGEILLPFPVNVQIIVKFLNFSI